MTNTTPKHNLPVIVEERGCKCDVTCRATQSFNDETDEWFVAETFEIDCDPEWNDIYDLESALKSIDDRVDFEYAEAKRDGRALHIYQL